MGPMKLGSWTAYLEMREVIIQTNAQLQPPLSNDLGAFTGLLFDIGVGKIAIESNWSDALALEREAIEKAMRKRHQQIESDRREEDEHLEIQYLLTTIGRSLGYYVHVAANDRGKDYQGERLSFLTLDSLPAVGLSKDVAQTVALIDVVWLSPDKGQIVCAFEVEKTTSIYSGILRLVDLANSLNDRPVHLFLVAPDTREKEILAQLNRPAFGSLDKLAMRYILFAELCEHCAGLCKFGEDYRAILKIARTK